LKSDGCRIKSGHDEPGLFTGRVATRRGHHRDQLLDAFRKNVTKLLAAADCARSQGGNRASLTERVAVMARYVDADHLAKCLVGWKSLGQRHPIAERGPQRLRNRGGG